MKIEFVATIIFAIAVLHTFLTAPLLRFSHHFPADSFLRGVFHLLGEIEIVFGFWAGVFFILFSALEGPKAVISYQESLNFTEPMFVFVIMVVASTKPILFFAQMMIERISHFVQLTFRTPAQMTDLFIILSLGPLLGSFITEPATMTVVALLLRRLAKQLTKKLVYAMLAVLFVNVSIGGALTPYAAPPILMVAHVWSWDFSYVFFNFGIRSLLAVVMNSLFLVLIFKKELAHSFYTLKEISVEKSKTIMPMGVIVLHLLVLILIVLTAHYQSVFMGLFLFFLGITVATKKYQDQLRIRESLLVAFFLAGIIVFGVFQKWWLQPLLSLLSDRSLFLGSVCLTAITDNAALTYLGSQVQNLSEISKYSLVSGAIAGGGLTVIANAPNAAGYSILADLFPGKVVSPMSLFIAALAPTLVAIICFW